MDIICGKTPAYIPTSANEIISAIEIVKKSMRKSLPPKLRIGFLKHDFSATIAGLDKNLSRLYTDYKRLNETHFWSDIASSWWSHQNDSQRLHPDPNNLVLKMGGQVFQLSILRFFASL